MSDDDEFMMEEGDDEEYDFEYEGSDQEEEGVDIENDYYTAKSQRDEPDVALASFQRIVDNENKQGEQSEYGFKALKQMTKLTFRLGRFDAALAHYRVLLSYTKKAVTRNTAEKSINKILDYVSASPAIDTKQMQAFYEVTMQALEDARNERLSQKTNLKLAKLWLDRKEYPRLTAILRELHASCDDSTDDATGGAGGGGGAEHQQDSARGTLQLEVFALEIQMYNEMKNHKKLREIYERSLRVRAAISHPRIQGVIRECGGKMFMSEKEWAKAQIDFFEAFKSYDEAGSPQRTQVLKYLVLAHMLMESEINPFDSQETKPYKNDPEIVAMTNLVAAYQRRDVHEAEKILRDNRATIMDDPFIREHIGDVLRSLRTQWILTTIKPYTRVELPYLARQLRIPTKDVEEIVVALILDERIQGRVDQVSQRLELDRHKMVETRRYAALDSWSERLESVHRGMMDKVATHTNSSNMRSGPGGSGSMGMGGGGPGPEMMMVDPRAGAASWDMSGFSPDVWAGA